MPKKFDPTTDIPDLSGRVILITGGNAGIGAATTRALAAHSPACIYLCSRNRAKGEALVKSIHEKHPKANIHVLELDLASFDSVKKCAAEFNRMSDRLDLLFLNAGVVGIAPGLTSEGYEVTFGTNHMGHALLTQLLMPKLLHAKREQPEADVRIMVTSSNAGAQQVGFKGLALGKMHSVTPFGSMVLYTHSKFANILFAKKLAQQYPSIISTSSNPGMVKSEIFTKAAGAPIFATLLSPIVSLMAATTDEGAKNQLWGAVAAGVENGMYYDPVGVKKPGNSLATDQGLIDELWTWTNEELAKHGAPGWPEL